MFCRGEKSGDSNVSFWFNGWWVGGCGLFVRILEGELDVCMVIWDKGGKDVVFLSRRVLG